MAQITYGGAKNNELVVRADKTQAYGLKGNDTLVLHDTSTGGNVRSAMKPADSSPNKQSFKLTARVIKSPNSRTKNFYVEKF